MVAHVITDQPPRRFATPDKRPLPRASIIDYEYVTLRNHVGSQSIPDSVADSVLMHCGRRR
jgi:hypothetical protein